MSIGMIISCATYAAEIRLLAGGPAKDVCLELLPSFETATAQKVIATWSATSGDIKKRMDANEVFDVVVSPAPGMDGFIQEGRIVAESRAELMKAGVGVAVRTGTPRPAIGSTELLKQTVLAAKTIGISTGPSGQYVTSLFARLGIAEQIKSKMREMPPGMRVGAAVASGEVEVGLQLISELIHESGIDYVGPLPADVQNYTVFSLGISSRAREPDAARSLIKHLTSPAAAAVIKAHGMEPG